MIETGRRFYNGVSELVLLKIDTEKLDHEVKFEQSESGEWFPHLYAALNFEAVTAVANFVQDESGHFRFPFED